LLLISHWEVSSNSTVKLITKAIAELKANPKIGRAELALARFDALIGILQKQVEKGTATPEIITRLDRLQQLRDDLDVQIGLERINRGTYLRRRHRRLYS
jgi:hypothetical protein